MKMYQVKSNKYKHIKEEWHIETISKLDEYQWLLRVILQQLENPNKEELLKQFNLQRSYISGDSIRPSDRFGSDTRSDRILLNFR